MEARRIEKGVDGEGDLAGGEAGCRGEHRRGACDPQKDASGQERPRRKPMKAMKANEGHEGHECHEGDERNAIVAGDESYDGGR